MSLLVDKQREIPYNYNNVEKWTIPFQNIFKTQQCFFPIHTNGNHWSFVETNSEKKQIIYHDSLNLDGTDICQYIQAYLTDTFNQKNCTEIHLPWKIIAKPTDKRNHKIHQPTQTNSFDCGIFLLMGIEAIIRQQFKEVDQSLSKEFRNFVRNEIIKINPQSHFQFVTNISHRSMRTEIAEKIINKNTQYQHNIGHDLTTTHSPNTTKLLATDKSGIINYHINKAQKTSTNNSTATAFEPTAYHKKIKTRTQEQSSKPNKSEQILDNHRSRKREHPTSIIKTQNSVDEQEDENSFKKQKNNDNNEEKYYTTEKRTIADSYPSNNQQLITKHNTTTYDTLCNLPNKNTHWGDPLNDKQPNTIRLFFQNINSIQCYSMEKTKQSMINLQHIGADIIGLAETCINWKVKSNKHNISTTIRGTYKHHAMSIPTIATATNSKYLPGGTLSLVTDKWANRVIEKITDTDEMGRWTGFKLRLNCTTNLYYITGYRPPNIDIRHSGKNTTARQQFLALRKRGIVNPAPRE